MLERLEAEMVLLQKRHADLSKELAALKQKNRDHVAQIYEQQDLMADE